MSRVLALVDDLFFQAKIMAAARQAGVELCCCTTAEALVEQARAAAAALILVDLNARADALGAVEQLAAGNSAPVVAFLSHVQTDLAERARRAGCAEVMPRSQFSRDLPAILARAKATA
jgi:DNA-binding NarL/FixJ family response regulator